MLAITKLAICQTKPSNWLYSPLRAAIIQKHKSQKLESVVQPPAEDSCSQVLETALKGWSKDGSSYLVQRNTRIRINIIDTMPRVSVSGEMRRLGMAI